MYYRFSNNYSNIESLIESSNNYIEENINQNNFITLKKFDFVIGTKFIDFSQVIHSFTVQDYYSQDVSYIINVQKGLEFSVNRNNIYDFNQFIFQQFKILSNDTNYYLLKFNKITKKTDISSNIRDISDIYIRYEIFDAINRKIILRKIDIIDIQPPTILFHEINNNYVTYNDNLFKDFNYQAIDINYRNNKNIAINELSNILLNFTIQDNYSNHDINSLNYDNLNKNFKISIKRKTSSEILISDIVNFSDISNNIHLLNDLSMINMEYEIIYDISDNQYNYSNIVRNLNIVNYEKPLINFINSNNNNENFVLTYQFGDTDFSLNNLFNFYHNRLNYPIELSYNLMDPTVNSLIGYNYDPSAVIYSIPDTIININKKVKDFSFRVYSYMQDVNINPLLTISSEYINLPVRIVNNGPTIKNSSVYSDFSFQNWIFEAGLYIQDISLIYDIVFDSSFDKFYYNSGNIRYTETNFITQITPPINQNSPEVGNYILTYTATDKNDVQSVSFNRNIFIRDNTAPNIILKNISNNNTTYIDKFIIYIDAGAEISDYGSELNTIEVKIYNQNNNLIRSTNLNLSNLNIRNYTLYDDSIRLTENETSIINNTYIINYKITDKANKIKEINRKI